MYIGNECLDGNHANCVDNLCGCACHQGELHHKREDFNVAATSRGYQVQYKGRNIGGAGIRADAKAPRGLGARAQVQTYIHYGQLEISYILDGHGRPDMLKEIARIDAEG